MSQIELPKVTFISAVKYGFSNKCLIKGRIRKSEFWFFFLFTVLIFIPTLIFFIVYNKAILEILGIYHSKDGQKYTIIWPIIVLGALLLINIVLSFPLVPLSIRRLHDTGRAGYYLLLIFIPIAGIIVIMIFLLKDSDPNNNDYGSSHKYITGTNDNSRSSSLISSNSQLDPQNIQNQ